MDNHHLRAIILKLQDRLSDNDRKRLHFFLGNDVPRRIRDDPSLSGTLSLMESLFDQDKINERDFSFLIHAFDQIQCTDAVKILKEHKKRMLSSSENQSTHHLGSIMPSIIDEIMEEQEDDQDCTDSVTMNLTNNTGSNNNIINSNNTNINPLTINVDTQRILSKKSRQNKLFYIFPFPMTKQYSLVYLLIIIALGILIISLIVKKVHQQNNRTIKQLNNLISEQNKTIQQLNNQLTDFKKERSTLLVKAGEKFGGTGGSYFDDSSLPGFTFHHYLSGIVTPVSNNDFDSCQFHYSSSYNNESRIESNVHGKFGQKMESTQKFDLNQDEKIYKVQVNVFDMVFLISNGTLYTTKIIKALKFFTTKGRSIPPYSSQIGKTFTEEFGGYTLGYVTGQSGQCIDQLQFFWYRTT